MNPPKSILWGPENEALLKSLRLSAGIDLATLARRNIVSITQVRQLENGGDSSFYSPEIKYSVGKKLLKYLGHELRGKETLATPASTSPDLTQVEAPSMEAFQPVKASSGIASENSIPQSDANLATQSATENSSVVLPLFLSGAVVFVALWFWLDNDPPLAQPPLVNTPAELKSEIKAELNEASLPEKPPSPSDAENTAANLQTTTTPQELAKPDTLSACNWNNIQEEIQPDSPHKAGEYVHVIAQQASTVCIMDGQKRVAVLNLQVGDARSIYGLAPFRVYSADLRSIKVYFQGQYIKLPSQEMTQIKLTPAPYIALKN